jgi:hypothetical protein
MLNRNHLTYVRESWTWHVDAMQFHGGTHDEQLGTYVGLRKNRAENQPDDACCESPKSAVYARTTQVPDPVLEEPNRGDIGQARDVNKLRYDQRRGTARIRKAIHSLTGAQI